jgi:cytochrome oxidase Cu insertion factor (SCO1/SenC/PrrC family)
MGQCHEVNYVFAGAAEAAVAYPGHVRSCLEEDRLRREMCLLALLAIVGPLASVSAAGSSEEPAPGLVGNMIHHTVPAPDFTLTDQHGQPFHMADSRGKVVVLCFIYTHCTDICPYISVKVRDAYQLLGPDESKVVFVAVTTDPARDVPEVTRAYSKALGLDDVWHFVGGAPKQVQAVWKDYAIGVTVNQDTEAVAAPAESMDMPVPSQGLSKEDLDLAGELADAFGGGYDVGHSAPFWIVDTKGVIQVGMDAEATPSDLVTDIRTLLKRS